MICILNHQTTYHYDQPVFLEPQTIRLFPRLEMCQALRGYQLTVDPKPAGLSSNVDVDGSLSRLAWFNEKTQLFSVSVCMDLKLTEKSLFDYIVFPQQCQNLPMQYPCAMFAQLAPYCSSSSSSLAVVDFAYESLRVAKEDTLNFLITLCQRIQKEFAYEIREAGEPHSPAKTLSLRRGSCRDFTVLFIEATRALGLASRFVSGYYFDSTQTQMQLHAWAETYIPGAGWRGFDPTLGLVCGGYHVVLATGSSASLAAPITGHFRGDAQFTMSTQSKVDYSV